MGVDGRPPTATPVLTDGNMHLAIQIPLASLVNPISNIYGFATARVHSTEYFAAIVRFGSADLGQFAIAAGCSDYV